MAVSRLVDCAHDRRAVAAVEFAFILPVLLLLYIGTLDVTRAVMASRKVDIVSRTISDLVSQRPTTSTVSSSTISTIFAAASAIMQPYSTSALTETVSGVTIKAKTNGTCCDAVVNWSYTQSGALRSCGSTLTQVADGTPASSTTIPASLIMANQQAGFSYTSSSATYLVIADVRYLYSPFFSQAASWFTGAFQMTTYMVPRAPSGQILLATPVTAASSGQSGCST